MKKIYLVFYSDFSDLSKIELCTPVTGKGKASVKKAFITKMEGSEYNIKDLRINNIEYLCSVGLESNGLKLKNINTFELWLQNSII
tara:strand:+ start:2888 stop:3145 length:258 start_codon:yes stop_codon:yes gene_type:complete